MFFRVKVSGPRRYLQIVENEWVAGRTKQTVLATVGRLDELALNGKLDSLLASGARFSEQATLLARLDDPDAGPRLELRRIGAPLAFGRLWDDTGCKAVIDRLLAARKFEFPVDRAVFVAARGCGSSRGCGSVRIQLANALA